MKTIVCFGDSNTYGMPPMAGPDDWRRHGPDIRWPGVLQARLGAGWQVIEEGLPGRTTLHDDPIEGRHKNGLAALPILLESHRPIDILILNLGTNDLKARFSLPAEDIAASIGVLLAAIAASPAGPDGKPPKALVIAPASVTETGFLGGIFRGATATSRRLGALYAAVAARHGAAFLDADTIIHTDPLDGIHLAADQHAILGEAVYRRLGEAFAAEFAR